MVASDAWKGQGVSEFAPALMSDGELKDLAREVFRALADRNEMDGRSIANEAAIAAMTNEQLDRLCRFAAAEMSRRIIA